MTTGGDSLNCKITKEDDQYLYFSFKQEGEPKETLITRKDVVSYQRAYFAQPDLSAEEIEKVKAKVFKPVKLGLAGGWGYRTGKLVSDNPEQKDYLKGLKSGFQLSADFDYYFNDLFGIGLKYALFRASANGRVMGTQMEDKTTTQFIGPTFAMRFLSFSKKNAFIMNYSAGYLSYLDKGSSSGRSGKLTAGTFGLVMDLGYEAGLSENLAILFQLSAVVGTFSSYTFEEQGYSQKVTLPDDERENLSRIDLSIGLRFNP